MRILCALGMHDWECIGPIEPIKDDSDFSSHSYLGHFALGKCKWCSKKELRRCSGKWEWYWGDELTEKEYTEKYGVLDEQG